MPPRGTPTLAPQIASAAAIEARWGTLKFGSSAFAGSPTAMRSGLSECKVFSTEIGYRQWPDNTLAHLLSSVRYVGVSRSSMVFLGFVP
jgi:hypothetical protein